MEKLCSDCTEPTVAQSLCTYCNRWLCFQCTDVHQHQPITQCTELHQGTSSSPTPPDTGSSSCPRPLLTCHCQSQEPLELFCESCNLMCCSSCPLSTHKNHRVVHVGKALQDQQWLFESLMAQLEERKTSVENTAKQIQDRLRGVKITQKKAENQIKMAKMIMMNELNKRANLLIEQLEKISGDFKQCLDKQLQGAIELCSQLDYLQNFITWATTHHRRKPLLFSKELITFQVQRLLEPQIHSDCWLPVKIKFNWDASFWTKQISSLGQLTTEGGNRSYSDSVACPSILRPQPMNCLAIPSLCHGVRDQDCSFQACCQFQMCCLHCLPTHPPEMRPDETRWGQNSCSVRRVKSGNNPPTLHQSQLQRRWNAKSAPALLPSSMHRRQQPSPIPAPEPLSPSSSRLSPGKAHSKQSQSLEGAKEPLPNRHTQAPEDGSWSEQGQQVGLELTNRQHLPGPPAAELSLEQQARWHDKDAAQQPQDQSSNRRYTSLDMSASAEHPTANAQSRPGSLHGRRNRSKSIPAELATPPTSSCKDRSRGATHSLATATRDQGCMVDKYGCANPRKRRLSEGAELAKSGVTTSALPPSSSMPSLPTSPLNRYKTEPGPELHFGPDHVNAYANEGTGYDCQKGQRSLGKSQDLRNDNDDPKVPAVCLEKLKVLVTHLSPQGRRQGDPLPTSTHSALAPEKSHEDLALKPISFSKFVSHLEITEQNGESADKMSTVPPSFPVHEPVFQLHSGHVKEPDINLESECRRASGPELNSESDFNTDSAPQPESASEADLESEAETDFEIQPESDPVFESECCLESELSLESEPYGESDFSLDSQPHIEIELSVKPQPHPQSQLSMRAQSQSQLSRKAQSHLQSQMSVESPLHLESESSVNLQPHPESELSLVSQPNIESEQPVNSLLHPESELSIDSEMSVELQPHPESELSRQSQPLPESELSVNLESELPVEIQPHPKSELSRQSQPLPESELSVNLESELSVESETVMVPQSDHGPYSVSLDGVESEPVQQALSAVVDPEKKPGSREAKSREQVVEMESEDFCAVCLIGGELLCCDRCPKVFHLSCHVPSLLSFPTGDWVCTLCRDILQPEMEYDCEHTQLCSAQRGKSVPPSLSACDQRKCEKLTLFISSNILSAPFHEPVSPLARHYYQIIKNPMDLSVIRGKLQKSSPLHYVTPEDFVADVCLMFRNCAKFNYPDSEVAQAGRSLQAFFHSKLRDVYPARAFPAMEEDSDSEEYDEVCVSGFPWPERKEQCHKKRKRRASLRHHL